MATGHGLDGPGIESRWEAIFSAPVQTGPRAHPASCTKGTGSFPRVKSGRGVTLTPHPLLLPRSWKCWVIPLLPLWAVQPVQSLSACTRVHFYNPWLPKSRAVRQHISGSFILIEILHSSSVTLRHRPRNGPFLMPHNAAVTMFYFVQH